LAFGGRERYYQSLKAPFISSLQQKRKVLRSQSIFTVWSFVSMREQLMVYIRICMTASMWDAGWAWLFIGKMGMWPIATQVPAARSSRSMPAAVPLHPIR
jgi:hypothetical protein